MRIKMKPRSVRLAIILALIMLAAGMVACSVSIDFSEGDDDGAMSAIATANAHLATRVAANEAMLSYLATLVPRVTRRGGIPDLTPTPYLPVHGTVIIEEGRCCVGSVAGDTIQVGVGFRAGSPLGEVTEMRVRVGGMPFSEREMAEADWDPFVRYRRYPVRVALNWVGFYVSVQYRDARGNLSPIYHDDISVEGMPPTPTVSPD